MAVWHLLPKSAVDTQPDTGDTGTGTLAVVPEGEGAETGATITKGERGKEIWER